MSLASIDRLNEVFGKNVLAMNEAKENGKKVMGMYCLYTPAELAVAAGAMPVSLCGTRNDSIPVAEEILPRTTCPLIKSSFGFALQDSCAYLSASDLVVADATCDGKKKMYELLAKKKPLLLLQLPQEQSSDESVAYWKEQVQVLKSRLEKEFNITIADEDLKKAMDLLNRERRAVQRIFSFAAQKPAKISGMQLVEICFKAGFLVNKEEEITLLNAIVDELDTLPSPTQTKPCILLTGVPMGMGSHKIVQLLEESGADVVCLDNCSAYKRTQLMMDTNADDLLFEIAKQYLQIPCACMSPNPNRYQMIQELAAEFQTDAVVDLTWQGCQTYEIESYSLKNFVKNELKLPFLQLISDYSESDIEQLRVRVEAFLEILK